jgi:iron(III) transport system substrate-binding protein
MANPASSGTAYTMIATLVQLMGEDKAFRLPQEAAPQHQHLHPLAAPRPIKAAARGETAVSISFVHDVTTEAVARLPRGLGHAV